VIEGEIRKAKGEMAETSAALPASAPRTGLGAALLVIYVVAVAWMFHDRATDWPHVGDWGYVVFFLLCPGIVFQLFRLAYARHTGRPLARRWLPRLATIPLGLVLAALLMAWADGDALRGFERAYAPLVSGIAAALPDPCRAAAGHFRAPPIAAYNRRTGRDRPVAKLNHDDARFVLAFRGGSIDIDGSTIYYDSAAGAWRKFHNDDERARVAYEKLRAGLAECLVQAAD
jgi:hypothetical protein